ncbi:MAG: ABC transporter permease [Microbacterium sp.]|uniref:ABC transporter permease n=1 Tax=Microbacterium sp. TaxID=51671 RepID=UPI0039E35D57
MKSAYLIYAAKRLGQAVLVVLLAYVLTFVVISVLPGDPLSTTLRNPENGFTEDQIAQMVAYYGLDRPVLVQLWEALSRFVVGDLGISLRSSLPVARVIGDALPSTVALAVTALAVALVLAFAIAYGVQLLPRRYGQGLLRSLPALFLSIPNFVIGLLLLNVFAFQLGLFSVIDPNSLWATFFAAIALGIPVSAQIAEVLITGLDHEFRQEYAVVAYARGLGRTRLFFAHLLKPSALPVVTVIALAVGELLGATLITESVFGRAGIGSVIQSAVSTQDLPVLQAVVSLTALVFVTVNLLADLAYPLLDPRVTLLGPAARSTSAKTDEHAFVPAPAEKVGA